MSVTAFAPWTQAILDVLADGRWHTRAECVAAAANTVPPGVAYRVGEHSRTRHGPRRRVRGDRTTSVTTGGRLRARESLYTLRKDGRIEMRTVDGTPIVRLVPS